MENRKYGIVFYTDRRGHSPIKDFIQSLKTTNGKQAYTRLERIRLYMLKLQEQGTYAGMPVARHLDGRIWELRPGADRILFAAWVNGIFVLLHHFVKKTDKTPKREIEQAIRNYKDFISREA